MYLKIYFLISRDTEYYVGSYGNQSVCLILHTNVHGYVMCMHLNLAKSHPNLKPVQAVLPISHIPNLTNALLKGSSILDLGTLLRLEQSN